MSILLKNFFGICPLLYASIQFNEMNIVFLIVQKNSIRIEFLRIIRYITLTSSNSNCAVF